MNHGRKNSFQTSFTSIFSPVIQWYPQKLHKNIPSYIPIFNFYGFSWTGLHGIRHARGTQAHGEDQTGGQGRHEPGAMEAMALIEIDDFPQRQKPPFMEGIFHGELLNNQRVSWGILNILSYCLSYWWLLMQLHKLNPTKNIEISMGFPSDFENGTRTRICMVFLRRISWFTDVKIGLGDGYKWYKSKC